MITTDAMIRHERQAYEWKQISFWKAVKGVRLCLIACGNCRFCWFHAVKEVLSWSTK